MAHGWEEHAGSLGVGPQKRGGGRVISGQQTAYSSTYSKPPSNNHFIAISNWVMFTQLMQSNTPSTNRSSLVRVCYPICNLKLKTNKRYHYFLLKAANYPVESESIGNLILNRITTSFKNNSTQNTLPPDL